MAEPLDLVVMSRAGAHRAANAAYQHAQLLIADGHEVRMLVEPVQDDRSLRQNRFYWGVVLKEISQQARIEGQLWSAEAWHELMKRTHLGYEIERVKVAGRKRTTVIRRLRSTSTLKVKAMAKYLDQVLAFGATDLGVVFSESTWQTYTGR